MFEVDTAEILACEVFLIVLDGRVPDEGSAFELGVACACKRLEHSALEVDDVVIARACDAHRPCPASTR
jgi:nucleoside 2-deoxyribosyltransferase